MAGAAAAEVGTAGAEEEGTALDVDAPALDLYADDCCVLSAGLDETVFLTASDFLVAATALGLAALGAGDVPAVATDLGVAALDLDASALVTGLDADAGKPVEPALAPAAFALDAEAMVDLDEYAVAGVDTALPAGLGVVAFFCAELPAVGDF